MTDKIMRPLRLQINAWNGEVANGDELPNRSPWAQREQTRPSGKWLAPAARADPRDWRHPDIGWGLVLPDSDALGSAERMNGADAPEPIRRLLAARPGAPVLRWSMSLGQNFLRRYYADGRVQDLSIAAPKPGVAEGHIPRYLLIYGSPEAIPWPVQYALNMSTFVGRLDLTNEALDRYVNALLSDWSATPCQPRAPVVWRVDHGRDDITWLMARAVAGMLWTKLESDTDLTGRFLLRDGEATRGRLGEALAERTPGLIVTTSHGMTGPLGDEALMRAQLGVPVDVARQPLQLSDLGAWKPSGAIWYAHACCSAGADSRSRYADLFPTNSPISRTVNGIAATAGAVIAPLPQALLGGEAPLRAFVGHVEPTFDWTLRDPVTQQVLTHVITTALYDELYQQKQPGQSFLPTPIGYALRNVFAEAGAFFGAWQDAIKGIDGNVPGMRDWALYRQLVASDRQTLVILGDPTVSLPPLM